MIDGSSTSRPRARINLSHAFPGTRPARARGRGLAAAVARTTPFGSIVLSPSRFPRVASISAHPFLPVGKARRESMTRRRCRFRRTPSSDRRTTGRSTAKVVGESASHLYRKEERGARGKTDSEEKSRRREMSAPLFLSLECFGHAKKISCESRAPVVYPGHHWPSAEKDR